MNFYGIPLNKQLSYLIFVVTFELNFLKVLISKFFYFYIKVYLVFLLIIEIKKAIYILSLGLNNKSLLRKNN